MSTASFQGILRHFLIAILVLGCICGVLLVYMKIPATWFSNEVKLKAPAPMAKNFGPKEDEKHSGPKADAKNFGPKEDAKQTIILIWMWPFGNAFDTSSCRSLLNMDGCLITADRNMFDKANGVIMHHRDIRWDLSNLPKSQRPPFQKWVWMNFESPSNTGRNSALRSLFNLTVNYRQDADISRHYGMIVPANGKKFEMPVKNKLVCWVVSNWNPNYKRVKYYYALKEHVTINVYGRAFGKYLNNQDFFSTIASCKFYLSFENSIHKDYITEKLYNPMIGGTVPIVLGPSRQNYENFVPSDSFIHVDDFPSAKELAEHIKLLDKNEDQYRQYFRWRQHFQAKRPDLFPSAACFTCYYIRTRDDYKVINNLDTWFWG